MELGSIIWNGGGRPGPSRLRVPSATPSGLNPSGSILDVTDVNRVVTPRAHTPPGPPSRSAPEDTKASNAMPVAQLSYCFPVDPHGHELRLPQPEGQIATTAHKRMGETACPRLRPQPERRPGIRPLETRSNHGAAFQLRYVSVHRDLPTVMSRIRVRVMVRERGVLREELGHDPISKGLEVRERSGKAPGERRIPARSR